MNIKHANWVILGVLFCFLGIVLKIIGLSIDGDASDSTSTGGIWCGIAGILFTFIGLFAFTYNIFPKERRKVIALIFCILIVGTIINSLIIHSKTEKLVKDMEDYREEGEEWLWGFREPTDEEILEKYYELRRPLIPFVIINFLLELSVVIILLVSYFILNRSAMRWRKRYKYGKYEEDDEDEEEDEDDDASLDVLERLRRKQKREREKTTAGDGTKFEGEKDSPEMAGKESQGSHKKCIACGHPLGDENSRFCSVCGTNQIGKIVPEPEAPPKRCVNCGVGLAPGNVTFCHVCGARQGEAAPVQTAMQTNRCIDCGAAVKPPLVFCDKCMAKQLYSAPAQQAPPSPNVPLPTEPPGGRYVHQQQAPDIPLVPQGYGQQNLHQADPFLPPPPQ